MPRIRVTRRIGSPHDRVWAALADLASHVTWMKDAEWLVFVTDQERGVGTRMEVRTVVGPFRTLDQMEVVGWDEGRSIEVEHRGLISGRGVLSAVPDGEATVVEWVESLRFPRWLGGVLTAWLARPVLVAVWRGNLRRLEETLTPP